MVWQSETDVRRVTNWWQSATINSNWKSLLYWPLWQIVFRWCGPSPSTWADADALLMAVRCNLRTDDRKDTSGDDTCHRTYTTVIVIRNKAIKQMQINLAKGIPWDDSKDRQGFCSWAGIYTVLLNSEATNSIWWPPRLESFFDWREWRDSPVANT